MYCVEVDHKELRYLLQRLVDPSRQFQFEDQFPLLLVWRKVVLRLW